MLQEQVAATQILRKPLIEITLVSRWYKSKNQDEGRSR